MTIELLEQRVSILETMLAQLLTENRTLTTQNLALRYLAQLQYAYTTESTPDVLCQALIEEYRKGATAAPDNVVGYLTEFYGDIATARGQLTQLLTPPPTRLWRTLNAAKRIVKAAQSAIWPKTPSRVQSHEVRNG